MALTNFVDWLEVLGNLGLDAGVLIGGGFLWLLLALLRVVYLLACAAQHLGEVKKEEGEKIGRKTGRKTGRKVGGKAGSRGKVGSREGKKAGRKVGRKAWRKVERKSGRKAGKKAERKAGRKAGKKAERKAGRKVGRKAGRKVGRKEGKKAGRKAGRKVGRKADLVDHLAVGQLNYDEEEGEKAGAEDDQHNDGAALGDGRPGQAVPGATGRMETRMAMAEDEQDQD